MDAEPVQVCLRCLLVDVRRGAHNAPHCDDVGHLPTHPGNFAVNFKWIVHSDHESIVLLRAAILCGVRADDNGSDKGTQ